jgi:hypothetical protein
MTRSPAQARHLAEINAIRGLRREAERYAAAGDRDSAGILDHFADELEIDRYLRSKKPIAALRRDRRPSPIGVG